MSLYPLFRLIFRFKVRGPQPPMEGPLIVAANHASLVDPVMLQVALRRRLHYLMTSDYYFKPFFNRYSRIMRCIPVMEGDFNRQAIQSSLDVLAAGHAIGVFPQGGLNDHVDADSGLRGIGLLIARSKVPVMPVRIRGTARVLPRGASIVRLHSVDVHLGEPRFFHDLERPARASRHHRLERVTRAVMSAIAEL
jgi:1-acyl-sn-glycerol-3-phosphate acyltransferase